MLYNEEKGSSSGAGISGSFDKNIVLKATKTKY